jgi:phage terminase small subunit
LTQRGEVLRIASQLGIDPKMAAACCMLLWEWADDETEDGGTNVPLLSLICHADRVTGVPGFGQAFADVGWLVENGKGAMFTNWDRHNSETAKTRMKEAVRKASWRKRRDKCPANVPRNLGPEKRREEKKEKTKTLSPREPNLLWDAVVAEWRMPVATATQRSRVGKLVAEFKGAGALPDEIAVRRKRIVDAWGPEKATPESVAKHWGEFDGTGPSQSRVGRSEAPAGKYDALMAKARAKSQSSGTELAFPTTGEEPSTGKG